MKIVAVDNYNRDSVEHLLVAENVPEQYAQQIADLLNDHYVIRGDRFCRVYPDDYKLWRGMEELVQFFFPLHVGSRNSTPGSTPGRGITFFEGLLNI